MSQSATTLAPAASMSRTSSHPRPPVPITATFSFSAADCVVAGSVAGDARSDRAAATPTLAIMVRCRKRRRESRVGSAMVIFGCRQLTRDGVEKLDRSRHVIDQLLTFGRFILDDDDRGKF